MHGPGSGVAEAVLAGHALERRALVIVPDRNGPAHGGDSVVLRKVQTRLEQLFVCDTMTVKGTRGSLAKILAMLRHQVPSEWAGYQSGEAVAAVAARLASQTYDHVFILYEALFHLAAAVPAGGPPVTLYATNLPSRFALGDGFADGFQKILAQRAEARTFRQPAARLVMISQADLAAAQKLGLAGRDVTVAPPGAPPAKPLAEDAVFKPECVVTGSYAWWRKRRDLKCFAQALGLRTVHAFDAGVQAVIPSSVHHPDPAAFDWSSAIRLGVVTDRFGGGFKLKTLEYVANNCAIFSSAPVMAEFAQFPYAARFVFDNRDPCQLGAVLNDLAGRDPAILRAEFRAFKDAVCAHYDWNTCMAPLVNVPAR